MRDRCGDAFWKSNGDHAHCELAGGHAGNHHFGALSWGRELPYAIPSRSAPCGGADVDGCRCGLPKCALPAGSIIISPSSHLQCSIGAMRPGLFVYAGRLGFKNWHGDAYYNDGEVFSGSNLAEVTPCRVVYKIMD